jgi:hypothetical protein
MLAFPFAAAREREKLAERVSCSLREGTRQAGMLVFPFANPREREKLAERVSRDIREGKRK